ncbi:MULTISPECIES: HipA family kinase [Enterococcus]|uniref:HipA family kinase n=1 Tax=Enterococcus TaxID=1350 RepID=UPI00064C80A3|nr:MULTISPECIES: HipA family kinase [Enterococcus]NTL77189.1 hypothetical protein [Enterococcus faecium]WJW78203.1 hypothetical protein QWG62_01030 [Enterococcus faecium]WVI89096.1 HipA family kinase [Enterococcus lactis]
MTDQFFAETYLNDPSPQLGQSKPIKIIASNGKKYYLKTDIVDGFHQDAVFFQELLCSLLARQLNVPVPNFAIIEIEKEFVEANGELRFSNKFKPGLYFATEEISDVEDNLVENIALAQQMGKPRIRRTWTGYFKDVVNVQDYASIITFDLFVQNFDRFTNEGNLLVGNDGLGNRKVYAIDHGHAFAGPVYNLQKIEFLQKNKLPNYIDFFMELLRNVGGGYSFGAVFQGIQNNIDLTTENPFSEIIYKIENFSELQLKTILNEIPDEWVIQGVSQRNKYLEYLSRQKLLLRHIIMRMVNSNLFSNYMGGELEWKELKLEESPGIQ